MAATLLKACSVFLFDFQNLFCRCYQYSQSLFAHIIQQRVELPTLCAFLCGLLREKELVYGHPVTGDKLIKDLQAGMLPLIFNIHKVARGQEHFVAGFLAAVPMCLSRFLDGLSSRLEIKLWYRSFCHVNSPYYILLFPFLLEYVYTVLLDG